MKEDRVFKVKNKILKSEVFDGVNVVFTTNINGHGDFGNNMAFHVKDKKENVLKNREELSLFLHRPLDSFVYAHQVHGTKCVKVDSSFKGMGSETYEGGVNYADALYTYESGLALSCFYADCTPIYFYDETNGLIGIIHAGWQGTVSNIVEVVIDKLVLEESVDPKNLKFIIGPSIKKDSFEVSHDVYNEFLNSKYIDMDMIKIKASEKWLIDTDAYNENIMLKKGVQKENIFISNIDTYKEEELFSFRRDKEKSGRMMGVIYR